MIDGKNAILNTMVYYAINLVATCKNVMGLRLKEHLVHTYKEQNKAVIT